MQKCIGILIVALFLCSCTVKDADDKCFQKHELDVGILHYACYGGCIDRGGDYQTCYNDCLLMSYLIVDKAVCGK